MIGGMMAGAGGMMGMPGTGRITKKDLTTLTRTDFLLQFVWLPLKPEEQPKNAEDLRAKITDLKTKMDEVEKNHPAVTMPTDKEIETASLKQSKEFDTAVNKALTGPAAGAGAAAPGGPGGPTPTPGFGPPPAGATPPVTPAPAPGAAPAKAG
jgi:type IV pilus assembly protein PilM